MTLTEFRETLSAAEPPSVSAALQALWHDGRGDWQAAHDRLQDGDDRDIAWVHAYLHRKEGDLSNAGYWYRRAGRPTATGPLGEEWTAIAEELLTAGR